MVCVTVPDVLPEWDCAVSLTATLPGTARQGKCAPHCLPEGRVAVQVSVPERTVLGCSQPIAVF
jgi:hypothetical protein